MALSKCIKPIQFDVEELLNGFKNNKCRLCGELFCCHDCRLRHEGCSHKVNVDCSLCIYGFGVLSRLNSPGLLQHVNDTHLRPISRCLYCDRFISVDTILQNSNSLCTLTNFTDNEIKEIWNKMPKEISEEFLNPCFSAVPAVSDTKNDIANIPAAESPNVEEATFNSPTIEILQRQQCFEKGEFANSTPVQKASNGTIEDPIKVKDSSSNEEPFNHQQSDIKNVLEDSVKTRKVQFDTTPQPLSSKSPVSFHVLAIKSAIKKNKKVPQAKDIIIVMPEKITDGQPQGIGSNDDGQITCKVDNFVVDKKESCPTERITVPVKPMKRDLNTSAIVEMTHEFTFDGTEGSHWVTAFDDLPDFKSETCRSDKSSIICDLMNTSSANDIQCTSETEVFSSPSKIKEVNHTVNKRLDSSKITWTDIWTKCKCLVSEFTRTSMKRSRSELEASSDLEEKEVFSTPLNKHKRMKFDIRARRPIHYYIKPEAKRHVKKIHRGMQTSM